MLYIPNINLSHVFGFLMIERETVLRRLAVEAGIEQRTVLLPASGLMQSIGDHFNHELG